MLHLVYSSRTESLLEALVTDLAAHREEHGALEPAHLVVPDPNVERYLRLGIAQHAGVAANLVVRSLPKFVSAQVEAGPERVQVVDSARLSGLLLGLLLDDAGLTGEALAPVRAYLRAAGDGADAVDLRRFQLAHHVGRLYGEYAFSREGLLREWPRRAALQDTPFAGTEAWQRELWLRLLGPEGALTRRAREEGARVVTLADLAEGVDFGRLPLPPRLFVFGLQRLGRAYQRVLGILAGRMDVRVYSLNPCREFWEDVRTPREDARAARRVPRLDSPEALDALDPWGLAGPGSTDTPALRLWGRPGREGIRLLNELADCDFTEAFPEEGEPGSLLARLQQDTLTRAPVPDAPAGLPADGSLQVLACPGLRRQAEVVAEEVWRLVQESRARGDARPLRFNDIAVLVASRDAGPAFAHLAQALRACHDIPHNVADLSFASVSRVAEAAGLLLDFPLGGFSRPEVLRVLTHPVALARLPGADAEAWATWCERLGVVHGADRQDHAGTYISRDILNWDQGLRRLALGAFLAPEDGDAGLEVGGELYVPEDCPREGQVPAAQLAQAVRSLLADARWARTAKRPLGDWARFMAALLEAHLGAAGDAEARELERCLQAVRGVADVDLGGPPDAPPRVSYRIARELAAAALEGLGGGRGQMLADGVVLSGLRPMRALPFRVVFVLGLGEGEFPAVDRRDPLDLRRARPQAGDVGPREQDRYTFLETLLCARERLYLGYVARDALTGETLEPSPVVHELLQLLERCYLGRGGAKTLVRKVEALRHASAAPVLPPAVRHESAAVALRRTLEATVGDAGRLPDLDVLRRGLPPAVWDALARRLGLCPPPSARPARAPADGPLRLSTAALRRFLEFPLQGHAEHVLGLETAEEGDVREREHERFETPNLDAVVQLRRVFMEVLARGGGGSALADAYRAAAERLERQGQLPTGVFGEVERRQHTRALELWWEGLGSPQLRGAQLRVHRLGGAMEGEAVDAALPALALEVPVAGVPLKVELHGRVDLVQGPVCGTLLLQKRKFAGQKSAAEAARRQRDGLRAWVDQLVLAASGVHAEAPYAAHFVLTDGEKGDAGCLRLGGVSAERARAHLGLLVGELLSGTHPYLLPFDAVLAVRGGKAPSYAAAVREVLAADRYGSLCRPVQRLDGLEAPDEAAAAAMVERRLGPFFEALAAGEGGGEAGPAPGATPAKKPARRAAK